MQEIKTCCPYCGEPIHLLVDQEMLGEAYIEDCEVCCRPMVVEPFEQDNELMVGVKTENDV